ncbi:MAG: asparaginase [Bdellovibrionales bacterium]|nr:asparaginase [Bdellovibrionales bacterium]
MQEKPVIVLTTGGTIEKSYSEFDGSLKNRQSRLKNRLLSRLRLPHTKVDLFEVMAKDSLYMNDQDREEIWRAIHEQFPKEAPIVVLHGTDTMELTAGYCYSHCQNPPVPVIFTGAMKPMGFEDSDAAQNFIEALMAAHLVMPGFYISFHNHLFQVPLVKKNRKRRTFVSKDGDQ